MPIHLFNAFNRRIITLLKWCFISYSQILITFHPVFFKCLFTSLSRSLFLKIFSSQYERFDFGMTHLVGCPCQKSESIKITIFLRRNKTSGFPTIFETFDAKYIFRRLNSCITIRSGRVSLERICCIFFLRCSLVRLSIGKKAVNLTSLYLYIQSPASLLFEHRVNNQEH